MKKHMENLLRSAFGFSHAKLDRPRSSLQISGQALCFQNRGPHGLLLWASNFAGRIDKFENGPQLVSENHCRYWPLKRLEISSDPSIVGDDVRQQPFELYVSRCEDKAKYTLRHHIWVGVKFAGAVVHAQQFGISFRGWPSSL
jgi:hypothetical protein